MHNMRPVTCSTNGDSNDLGDEGDWGEHNGNYAEEDEEVFTVTKSSSPELLISSAYNSNAELIYETCGSSEHSLGSISTPRRSKSSLSNYNRAPINHISPPVSPIQSPRRRRLTRSNLRQSSSMMDLSHSSSSNGFYDFSLEALAGNASSSLLENGEPDYRAEISDLQLQVQKLTEVNVGLKSRVSVAQDENFHLLQSQMEELDKKEGELKAMNERNKRLERELGDKNATISSLEEKVTVLQNRNTRLENECSNHQKERKALVTETEELKLEVQKTQRLLTGRDDLVQKLKIGHKVQEKEWQDKEKWLNEQNERLVSTVDQMSLKLEALELERSELETKMNLLLKTEGGRTSGLDRSHRRLSLQGGAVMFASSHQHSFELDISSDDIHTEMLAAQANYTTDDFECLALTKRFDVATQCDEEQEIQQELVDHLFALTQEISEILESYTNQLTNGTLSSSPSPDGIPEGEERRKEANLRNGSDSKRQHRNKMSCDGLQNSNNTGGGELILLERNATEVVKQINGELVEFREQLKKSQELFNVLTITLTKSYPGLALIDYNNEINSKVVSCGTQTDSHEGRRPASFLPKGLDFFLQHHEPAKHLSSAENSMDASFDKLSNDGSVRLRDDLSMVLEVYEQENDASPGATRRTMNSEKGSINRPRLERMANTQEDEEGHSNNHNNHNHHQEYKRNGSSSSKGGANSSSDKNNHVDVLDASLMVTSDNDYETISGETTPVNEHEQFILTSENSSPQTPYQRFSLMGSLSESEPSSLKRNRGMIPDNKMQDMLRMAHCPVNRNTNPEASFLDNGEWRQLRQDTDRNDKETYRKTFAQAQEEGNEDEGAGGGGACGQSTYAFAADEEAEQYLETIPDLATKLFEALDVIRKKKRSGDDAPTQQDREDLDRKFNHMAEVFQTEHINLDQRICGLTKEFRESEANLKEISKSLKSSLSSLKNISAELSNDSLLDVMRLLANTSDEFEIYATGLSRSARRLGMMDVQNRLHKMIDVMVLYVHILRTECDNLQNLKSNYTSLQTDFELAKKLLSENEIPFTSTYSQPQFLTSSGTLQNNNEEKQRLFDEEELESSQSDRYEDGESEPEKIFILQHLLGPKKSSVGLLSKTDRSVVQEKRINDNLAIRCLSEGYDILRRELFWPYNLEETIKGLKQGFSVMLMILGLFVFIRGFLPTVSANDDGCSSTSVFKSLGTYFNSCGKLSHDDTPVI